MPAPIHAGDPEIPPTSPPEAPLAEVPLGVPPGGPAEVPEPPAEVPPGAPPEVPPPPQERALAVPAAKPGGTGRRQTRVGNGAAPPGPARPQGRLSHCVKW